MIRSGVICGDAFLRDKSVGSGVRLSTSREDLHYDHQYHVQRILVSYARFVLSARINVKDGCCRQEENPFLLFRSSRQG